MRRTGRGLLHSASLVALLAAAGPALGADVVMKPAIMAPPPAAGYPAVSAPNGKFDVRGGVIDGQWAGFAVGSYSLPVGHSFGVQFDALGGYVDNAFAVAFGGHAFWRDPRFALLGLYADIGYGAGSGGLTVGRVGGEGELYAGTFTLSGLAGYQYGDAGTGFFGKAKASLYVGKNFVLDVGYSHQPLIADRITFGAEALVAEKSGLSIFGQGRIGGGTYTALGGIRIYSGPSKALIDRHRRDDPGDHFDQFNDAISGFVAGCPAGTEWDPESMECEELPT